MFCNKILDFVTAILENVQIIYLIKKLVFRKLMNSKIFYIYTIKYNIILGFIIRLFCIFMCVKHKFKKLKSFNYNNIKKLNITIASVCAMWLLYQKLYNIFVIINYFPYMKIWNVSEKLIRHFFSISLSHNKIFI